MANIEFMWATFNYWEFIRELRNNEDVKVGFINQNHIDRIAHTEYMAEHWKEYMVCLENGEPVGYYGVVGGPDGDIRFCVDPAHQRKGLGTAMLKNLKETFPHASAIVKLDNEAAIKAFEKAGLTKKYVVLNSEDLND